MGISKIRKSNTIDEEYEECSEEKKESIRTKKKAEKQNHKIDNSKIEIGEIGKQTNIIPEYPKEISPILGYQTLQEFRTPERGIYMNRINEETPTYPDGQKKTK